MGSIRVQVYFADEKLWRDASQLAADQNMSLSKVVALLLQAYVAGEVVVNPAIVGERT